MRSHDPFYTAFLLMQSSGANVIPRRACLGLAGLGSHTLTPPTPPPARYREATELHDKDKAAFVWKLMKFNMFRL